MPADYLINYGKKTLVGTLGTFDSRFEDTQGEILRFAQSDSPGQFFRSLCRRRNDVASKSAPQMEAIKLIQLGIRLDCRGEWQGRLRAKG